MSLYSTDSHLFWRQWMAGPLRVAVWECLPWGFVWLVGWFLNVLVNTTRLYRGRAPRQSVWQVYVLPHMRQSWETMTSVSAGHIILTPTQLVGSGRPQWESNPWPPHQESRALPTELQCPPLPLRFIGSEGIETLTSLSKLEILNTHHLFFLYLANTS